RPRRGCFRERLPHRQYRRETGYLPRACPAELRRFPRFTYRYFQHHLFLWFIPAFITYGDLALFQAPAHLHSSPQRLPGLRRDCRVLLSPPPYGPTPSNRYGIPRHSWHPTDAELWKPAGRQPLRSPPEHARRLEFPHGLRSLPGTKGHAVPAGCSRPAL